MLRLWAEYNSAINTAISSKDNSARKQYLNSKSSSQIQPEISPQQFKVKVTIPVYTGNSKKPKMSPNKSTKHINCFLCVCVSVCMCVLISIFS